MAVRKRPVRKAPPRKRPHHTAAATRTARKPMRSPRAAEQPDVAVVARPAPVLSGARRKHMRGLAHPLQPIVHVGHAGVTDEVLAAVRQALLDHELIKVRLHEPEDKHGMAEALASGTASALCGLIGHTVILFKPHPTRPRLG